MKRNRVQLWVVLIAIFLITACATSGESTFSRDAYRALSISGNTYNTSMKAMADLYQQGVIGDGDKALALEYGTYFWIAYDQAVDAMEVYIVAESLEGRAKVEMALKGLANALEKFMAYVAPLLNK